MSSAAGSRAHTLLSELNDCGPAGTHTDTSPAIPHSRHFSPSELSGLGNAQACLDTSTPVDTQRDLKQLPQLPSQAMAVSLSCWDVGESRDNASTPLMHTCTHPPQLGKMQARRTTSEADQSCPVRKRAASELTQPEALLYCSGHNRIDCDPAPTLGKGPWGNVRRWGQEDREGEAAWRLDPGQERKGLPPGPDPPVHGVRGAPSTWSAQEISAVGRGR